MQPDAPTLCEDCDNVIREKSAPPFRWLCCKHKKLEGFGFVTKTTWDNGEPYMRCHVVNAGLCPLYQKAAPGQMTMGEITETLDIH